MQVIARLSKWLLSLNPTELEEKKFGIGNNIIMVTVSDPFIDICIPIAFVLILITLIALLIVAYIISVINNRRRNIRTYGYDSGYEEI